MRRNDDSCLDFPADLQSIELASRLPLEQVQNERANLRKGLEDCVNLWKTVNKSAVSPGKSSSTDPGVMSRRISESEVVRVASIEEFFDKARLLLDELDKQIDDRVKAKYSALLTYFGEEPTLSSSEFFFTLSKFTQVT